LDEDTVGDERGSDEAGLLALRDGLGDAIVYRLLYMRTYSSALITSITSPVAETLGQLQLQ